jgi:beta-carotene 3-hydroxylase
MYVNILTILFAFLFMEYVAWFTHKYVMHGFLWILHKDHHLRNHKKLEWNDTFALIFAIPSVILMIVGLQVLSFYFYVGLGIAMYGLAYFIFHDSLVHGRVKFMKGINNNYFRAVLSAHLSHHSGLENYGFLFLFDWKFFKRENQVDFDNQQHI